MGEVARTVGAVEDLIARGRSSGFGVVLISQRSATLNADVRTQADTIICHRVTAPLDRKAISDWFEENASTQHLKEILQSLATLKNGEAWAWAPAIDIMSRVQVRLRRTFDSSATPKVGETIRPPKQLTEIDITKLKGKMVATIEKAKADDPKELRKQISELQRKVQQLEARKPEAGKVERVEVSVFTEADRETLTAVEYTMDIVKDLIRSALEKTRASLPAASVYSQKPAPAPRREAPRQAHSPIVNFSELGHSGLRRILIALAQYPQGRSARQVGILAGLSSKSGSFNTYLSKGRSSGWIDGDRVLLRITDAGLAALGDFEPLPRGEDLIHYWLNELGAGGASRILRVLVARYPRSLSKQAVGEAAELSHGSGSFNTYLSKLRTLELIEGRGELKASDTLFE
jgi:hypothetical protein